MNKIEAVFYKENKIVYTIDVPYSEKIYGANAIEVSKVIAITSVLFYNIEVDKLVINSIEFDMKPDLTQEWFTFE